MKPSFYLKNLKTIMAMTLLAALLMVSNMALAATHTISMSAEVLPNGQLAYKMISHTSSEGNTPSYPVDAVIPGPTLFVKQGDVINVELENNTGVDVGFLVPDISSSGNQVAPGNTGNYAINVPPTAVGTFPYGDSGSQLLGLFGAIVVDNQDGSVQSFVDADGAIVPTQRAELDKEIVLFMVGSTFWGAETVNDTQIPLWTNPSLRAALNEKVRFHILSVGPGHTWHLHAHRWIEPTGIPVAEATPSVIDVKLLKDNFDGHAFTVQAGSGVGAGVWQYHCHLFSHMEAGMAGTFTVVAPGGSGASIAGASPSGAIFGNDSNDPGLVTFEITDEPGEWFRSARADTIFSITGSTKSLEIIPPGSSVHFIMSDTNAVHTMTSLLWPSDANDPSLGDHRVIPFDQTKAYKGGGILRLDTPGLYVFTCKIHPYMFGAVIVDDPTTDGFDLGETIDIVTGINDLPTSSDLATRLLRTFFVATSQNNWQDYTSAAPWHANYADVPVRITGGAVASLKDVLEARYGQDIQLESLFNPTTPGVGEVWIDTQFEKTAGKTKPGTITVLDATTWEIKRKIALPQINMNHPHNIWSNADQSIIFQTQWFDNKLTLIDRESGALLHNIQVGNSPSHVMTSPTNDDITVAINGENGISIIPAGTTTPQPMIMTQFPGQKAANPHGHWITPDGKLIVTPNINTAETGIYDAQTGEIIARPTAGGTFPDAPHPIAIGMGVDKIYTSNLLDHSINVTTFDGVPIKTINLIADYDPVSPTGDTTATDKDGDGLVTLGVLPIQTPVDPTGRVVVTANTGGSITIIDTTLDKVVAMLPCDPGCHGANFGAKAGGGYYAYVTSKFSNQLIVVDIDLDNPANSSIAGRISMVAGNGVPADDTVVSLAGTGGQGIYAVPNVYNGWVQNLPDQWKAGLTAGQLNPVP
jgi:plastocyanin